MDNVIERKKAMEVLACTFHFKRDCRQIIIREMVELKFIEPVNQKAIKVL